MSRVFLVIDDERIQLLQLDFSVMKDSPKYRKLHLDDLQLQLQDGFEITSESSNLQIEVVS